MNLVIYGFDFLNMMSPELNKKYLGVSSNVRLCGSLSGMSLELVNIRVHHGKGFINYCESGVDLYQFQYVDTSVSNPLQMRNADVLGWLHNFLQMDSLH